jgi:ankyrin repeat protein
MDAKELPARPSLEQYKRQAKDLVKARKSREVMALVRIKKNHPRFHTLADDGLLSAKFALADAQLIIAREHGFESWPKFSKHITALNAASFVASVSDPLAAFIDEAVWHGALERAEAILAAHPEIATANIHAAAILGDDAAVRRFLALDPGNATAKGGPRGWDALTYLCFSKYLRLDRDRSLALVRTAQALLDAGASANTGFYDGTHQPTPEWESALYGAAGVAHHPELTRLLLERGADPNDGEVPYHSPETYDNRALKTLVESGKLTQDSLATMLLRKADFHDFQGMKYLLEHGADPNRTTHWRYTALHQALRRDNDLGHIELLLDHGADPALEYGVDGKSAVSIAARRGRGDVLAAMERRGIAVEFHGVERLIAACARNDVAAVRSIAAAEPHLVGQVVAEGGKLLAEFAGTANTEGVRLLLDLGVNISVLYEGDVYFGIVKDSTALHVAAWKAWPATVRFLIERGAPVNAEDGKGRTALALAVKACVDSYWTERRSPDSVEALLQAGASMSGVEFPSGYAEVDELLQRFGKDAEL